MSDIPELSIVVPAYNAAGKLPRCVEETSRFLAGAGIRGEIVVVNDGSQDETGALATDLAAQYPAVRVLTNDRNRGKGYSVRRGMLAAHGERIMYMDDDLSTPLEEYARLAAKLDEGFDCAFGSRAAPGAELAVHQPFVREQLGRLGNRVIQGICPSLKGFRDTQCGFKLYRREVALRVFPLQRIERWGFDFEILHLLRKGGYRVAEVPVRWAHSDGSRVRPGDYARTFGELVSVRVNDLKGHYDAIAEK